MKSIARCYYEARKRKEEHREKIANSTEIQKIAYILASEYIFDLCFGKK